MSDNPSTPAAENAAGASSSAPASSNAASAGNASASAPKKPLPEQNPAFRMMGLPRLRLPSRNWMIFLSITGSFAGAVIYDKWQTKRMREKWCNMVSHIAEEPLDTKTAPRRMTIYLSAPPGDGLRSAREHFHAYIKPVLVAAAMDWDVVEGRKEGDVRHKTAERIRRRRKRNGEGQPLTEKEEEEEYAIDEIRKKNGDVDYPGVAGDLVVGRHTWKEYVRGLHEGWLGPPDPPAECRVETILDSKAEKKEEGTESKQDTLPTVSDAALQKLDDIVPQNATEVQDLPAQDDASPTSGSESEMTPSESTPEEDNKSEEDKTEEEEKPQRRFPPPYILPSAYETATLSPSTPDMIGPSIGVRLPHLLGFRNTPIRIYRFLTRRRVQDDIGRQVATAILASHRPFGTVSAEDEESASGETVEVPEQQTVLDHEERDWWKTVRQPRKEHEESVWIEPMALDERITSRMRLFDLTSEEQERAKKILQSGPKNDESKTEET